MKNLFIKFEDYYLFLDECGTAEINEKQDPVFLLCCIKVEKHYYEKYFRKQVKKFKKQNNSAQLVLHSTDIRKTRTKFSFLLNPTKRSYFLETLSALIQELEFEIYYFAINKNDILDPNFDIYWHCLRKILVMINKSLIESNKVLDIFCESRNKNQNNRLQSSYNSYFQNLVIGCSFGICFPPKIEFRTKDFNLFEINGLEITDLVAFPIFNKFRNKINNQETNLKLLKSYELIKPKIYGYEEYKKPPIE